MTVESVTVRSTAAEVFRLVSDPMRTGEWSPECVRCRWIGGDTAPRVGARFRGTSRNGWRRWTTTSEIVDIVTNERFAWKVTYFRLPVAQWEYRIDGGDHPGTVVLSEAVDDRRGRLLRLLSPYLTGSRDRAERNAATMSTTLEAIKAAAEHAP
jgi:uncharacterized protein YndB with AHSA1/START domain